MIITPLDVKNLCRLFGQGDTFDNDKWEESIFDAENTIVPLLKKRHLVPLRPVSFFSGTISCNSNSDLITGIGTNFLEKFEQGKYITFANDFINLQTYQIKKINSNTEIQINQNALETINNAIYYKMPEEICVSVKFQAAKFIFLNYFTEIAYNQETQRFSTQYDSQAAKNIKEFANGEYYCSDLLPAKATDTPSRKFRNYKNTNNDNFISKVNSFI